MELALIFVKSPRRAPKYMSVVAMLNLGPIAADIWKVTT